VIWGVVDQGFVVIGVGYRRLVGFRTGRQVRRAGGQPVAGWSAQSRSSAVVNWAALGQRLGARSVPACGGLVAGSGVSVALDNRGSTPRAREPAVVPAGARRPRPGPRLGASQSPACHGSTSPECVTRTALSRLDTPGGTACV